MVANIQVLRNFAAMVVVWHHLQQHLVVYLGAKIDTWFGVSGVDVFFVISGFIMFYTTRGFKRSTGAFWLDRAIRIVPLYWLATWMLAALFFMGFQPTGVFALDTGDLASAMVFWPDVRADGYPSPPLTVGWTLIYEMFFYLLFGLTFFMKSHWKSLAVLTAAFAGLWICQRLFAPWPYAANFISRPITLEFAAGGLLGILYGRVKLPRPAIAIPLGYVMILGGIGAILAADFTFHDRLNPPGDLRAVTLGVPSFFIVAGALMLESSGHVWRSKTLILLGGASYALYLFHPLITQALVKVSGMAFEARGPLVDVAVAVSAFAVTTFICVAIHLWVEKPLQQAFKSLTSRRPKPVEARDGAAA
jgi:peptidoglycan/LPS O-acetylase OafA/YrhL